MIISSLLWVFITDININQANHPMWKGHINANDQTPGKPSQEKSQPHFSHTAIMAAWIHTLHRVGWYKDMTMPGDSDLSLYAAS